MESAYSPNMYGRVWIAVNVRKYIIPLFRYRLQIAPTKDLEQKKLI